MASAKVGAGLAYQAVARWIMGSSCRNKWAANGGGPHIIEYERHAVLPNQMANKQGPYRRMATLGRPLPLLMVSATDLAEQNSREARGGLPMLTATQGSALAGQLTGIAMVWRLDGTQIALHCQR